MSTIVGQLLLQLFLILLNAFFAATEIAVISLNEKKVKAQADDGDKKAKKMLKMIEEPTGFLSTIQVGITLAGFLGSAFAADNFAERLTKALANSFEISESNLGVLNTISVIIITLILSFFTLVLGELVPKRLAMKNKEKLASSVCGFISGLAILLKPVVWLLTASTNGTLRIFGVDPNEKDDHVSEEDIVLMLDAGADEGSLNENDIEYIKNVFKLDSMTAEDVMTPRRSLTFINENATDEEIVKIIEEDGYTRMPVYSETTDNIIGILHARDYLLKRSKQDFTIKDAIFAPTFVPETAHLDSLFKDMQKEHNHIVVVINEYGETAGVVTMEDILEEIVGEIWDESDEAIEDIVSIGENKYRVLCSASIEDFLEFFDIEPEEEFEATTVNGWLSEIIGDIPEQGYTFDYENLNVTVTVAEELMAKEINVTVNEKPEETEEDE